MEKKDIIEGDIGSEGKYDVDFVDGKIVVDLGYKGDQGEAGVYLKLELIKILEIAAAKSDNKIDDSIVVMIKGMLA